MDSLFQKVKAACKQQLPTHAFKMWIEPIEFSNIESNQLILGAPNFYIKRRFQDQFAGLVLSEWEHATGMRMSLQVDVLKNNGKQAVEPTGAEPKAPIQLALPGIQVKPFSGRLLRRDFTFDQFVVGTNNDFAFSAALAHASRKVMDQNPLMLLSQTGMGKSHLSQAVGHHILSERPHERVFYMTAEDFTNEMVQSLRQDCIDKFKKKYRDHCDVLLLEDVHFLSGKTRTQSELAATLDYLSDTGKKIIFSSCFSPVEIPKISDSLRSRLSSGLITRIDTPNFRTRVRILQKKAKAKNLNIPDDVIHYLAGELSENVRQLESGLIGVSAKSSLLSKEIDLDLAESVVKHITSQRQTITVESIKQLVCKQFGISAADIASKSRKQHISRPRQIAMYLSRKYTDSPLQTIGRSFNRYHATVLHAVNLVESGIKDSGVLKQQVNYLVDKLERGVF
ncbi:MAG: chromosomal replication initiator protein DnaA [Desulfobacterales bacterium]|jgi:chromosomal replication initiator protein|nr:chromosomal replication initiator protein DnaA [Desulfobacterales bacterium]